MYLIMATQAVQLAQDHTTNECGFQGTLFSRGSLCLASLADSASPHSLPGNKKQGGPTALRLPEVQAEVDGRMQYADSPK